MKMYRRQESWLFSRSRHPMRKLVAPALTIAGVVVLVLAMASALQKWQASQHAVYQATTPNVQTGRPVLGIEP